MGGDEVVGGYPKTERNKEMRLKWLGGQSQSSLAREYGVSYQAVHRIVRRTRPEVEPATPEEIGDWVRRYKRWAAKRGLRPSLKGYDRWRTEVTPDAPASSGMRRRMGNWAAVMALADGRAPRHAWTSVEDELVLREDLAMQEIADAVGVTWAQVHGRRQTLRKDTVRKSLSGPPRVPVGRGDWLVAKTCTRCGELRDRDDYRRSSSDGYYEARCRACASEVGGIRSREQREHVGGLQRARLARLQAETVPGAGRRGEPWTGDELEVALRPDLAPEEAAMLLDRTLYGVQHIRLRYRRNATDPPPRP